MSCNRLAAWLATSPVMPAVIRLTVLLAGCAKGEAADAPAPEPTNVASVGAEPLADAGRIEGVVTDETLMPIAGVIVALSGRNRLRGFVEEVRVDGLLAQVRLRVGDQTLTAVITGDAVQELKLRRGDEEHYFRRKAWTFDRSEEE